MGKQKFTPGIFLIYGLIFPNECLKMILRMRPSNVWGLNCKLRSNKEYVHVHMHIRAFRFRDLSMRTFTLFDFD